MLGPHSGLEYIINFNICSLLGFRMLSNRNIPQKDCVVILVVLVLIYVSKIVGPTRHSVGWCNSGIIFLGSINPIIQL